MNAKMGRVCVAKNCNSGSAADLKRRLELNLRKPRFFEVPKQSPTKREKWIHSLATELNAHQHICHLHFQNDAIPYHDITNLPTGEIDKIMKGRITLTPELVPIVNQIQSPMIKTCRKEVDSDKISVNPEIHNEDQQRQQPIGEFQGNSPNELSENHELLGGHEQDQQEQGNELQFNNHKRVAKNLPQCRIAAKRRLSPPDENLTVKRQKQFEHEIDYNSQVRCKINENEISISYRIVAADDGTKLLESYAIFYQ